MKLGEDKARKNRQLKLLFGSRALNSPFRQRSPISDNVSMSREFKLKNFKLTPSSARRIAVTIGSNFEISF